MQPFDLDYWSEQKQKKTVRELGYRAFLSPTDYKTVLNLWIEKSVRIDNEKHEPTRRQWRWNVINKLSNSKNHRRLIVAGVKRRTKQDCDDLNELLDDAGGDPLMALNLCGVPALTVLEPLENLSVGDPLYSAAAGKLTHESKKICSALDYLARASDTLAPFMQDCLDQINRRKRIQDYNMQENEPLKKYLKYDVPEMFTLADHLRLCKTILQHRDEFIWLPQRRGRGGQVTRLLNGLILSLYEKSLLMIRQSAEGKSYPGEQINHKSVDLGYRAIDGLVAAVAFAIFPDAFKSRPLKHSGGDLSDDAVTAIIGAVRRTYGKAEREGFLVNTKDTVKAGRPGSARR